MIRLLSALWALFNVWMLLDCLRRRAPLYWLLVILLPGGELVYFFVVKRRSPLPRPGRARDWTSPDLSALRERAAEGTTQERLALATDLLESGESAEAASIYKRVLDDDPLRAEALYGLGRAQLALGLLQEAAATLERLVDNHPAHADYDGWPRLALVYDRLGRRDDALDTLHMLHRRAPSVGHALLYAHRLAAYGQRGQARDVLRRALAEHERSPADVRRRDADAVREARRRLARL